MLKPIEIALRMMPGLCGAFWLLFLLLYRGKSNSQKLLTLIALAFSADFLCQGMILSLICNDLETQRCELILIITSLFLFPLSSVYIHTLRRKKMNVLVIAVSFLPVILLSGVLLLITINAPEITLRSLLTEKNTISAYTERIHRLNGTHFSLTYWILYLSGSISVAIFSSLTLIRNKFRFGDISRFLTGKKNASSINVNCFLMTTCIVLACFTSYAFTRMPDNRLVIIICAITSTILIFFFFYIGIFFNGKKIWVGDLRMATIITSKDEFLDLKLKDALRFASDTETRADDELLVKFRDYIEEQGHYLDQDLTMEKVCNELGTNRTYVSLLLSEKINMPFRKYINSLRIKESKRIMTEEPNEILDNVATRCGFSSDSQLVRKFTEQEGVTPRVWLNAELKKKK